MGNRNEGGSDELWIPGATATMRGGAVRVATRWEARGCGQRYGGEEEEEEDGGRGHPPPTLTGEGGKKGVVRNGARDRVGCGVSWSWDVVVQYGCRFYRILNDIDKSQLGSWDPRPKGTVCPAQPTPPPPLTLRSRLCERGPWPTPPRGPQPPPQRTHHRRSARPTSRSQAPGRPPGWSPPPGFRNPPPPPSYIVVLRKPGAER